LSFSLGERSESSSEISGENRSCAKFVPENRSRNQHDSVLFSSLLHSNSVSVGQKSTELNEATIQKNEYQMICSLKSHDLFPGKPNNYHDNQYSLDLLIICTNALEALNSIATGPQAIDSSASFMIREKVTIELNMIRVLVRCQSIIMRWS
jgi:hypothetical protein